MWHAETDVRFSSPTGTSKCRDTFGRGPEGPVLRPFPVGLEKRTAVSAPNEETKHTCTKK